MDALLAQVLETGQSGGVLPGLAAFALYVVAGFLPALGAVYLIYFLLTLPLRRKERASLFLDFLEMGLHEGLTAEQSIAGVASSRDCSLGARFHLLAAHLEQGKRLGQALDEVPRLLPPEIVGMLKTGERIGDIRKVLPACRKQAQDAVSQVRGALNYLVLLAFAFSPFMLAVPVILKIRVLPLFRTLSDGMFGGDGLPPFTRMVFDTDSWFTAAQALFIVLLWTAVLAYLGGPRLHAWLRRISPAAVDWLTFRFPWRRKRLERDFSAMLAVLLDGGVGEKEALTMAADSTGNYQLQAQARRAAAALEGGTTLPEALRVMDSSGEFRWRMVNALKRGSGFLRALAGWHEALDAKAFQEEQAAAQLATTGLVLFNGLVVASIVVAVYLVLLNFLNRALLW
jgi:type II secretory pathway component PulF